MKTDLSIQVFSTFPDLFVKFCDAGAACTGVMVLVAALIILIRRETQS